MSRDNELSNDGFRDDEPDDEQRNVEPDDEQRDDGQAIGEPFIDFERVYSRLILRNAFECGLEQIKNEGQRQALRSFIDTVLNGDRVVRSDLAEANEKSQSAFHELLGRALVAYREILAKDPIVQRYLSSGEVE